MPSPQEYGWEKNDDKSEVNLDSSARSSQSKQNLIKCGCKDLSQCSRKCALQELNVLVLNY